MFETLKIPASIIDSYNSETILSVEGQSPATILIMLVNVFILSPGLILSGE